MKKNRLPLLVFIALFAALTITLTVLFWPFIKNLNDLNYREAFSAWVKELGVKGVAITFGLMVFQIVVAIIPGGPMELIAGAAYGVWGGLAICLAGAVFASAVIFITVKKIGTPLVHRFFGKDTVNSWKFLENSERNEKIVFILFLIPGTPKDLLTWLAPISRLPLRRFVILSNLGRIPAILSTTIMGNSVIKGNWVLFVLIFLLTAAAGLAGLHFKDKAVKFLSEKKTRSEQSHKTDSG